MSKAKILILILLVGVYWAVIIKSAPKHPKELIKSYRNMIENVDEKTYDSKYYENEKAYEDLIF